MCFGGVMRPKVLWSRLQRGRYANIRFSDVMTLLHALGFKVERVSGSHHIFSHPDMAELVNLQDARGQAKPYQLRQVVALAQRYALTIEEER